MKRRRFSNATIIKIHLDALAASWGAAPFYPRTEKALCPDETDQGLEGP